jgi:hypothetical protein
MRQAISCDGSEQVLSGDDLLFFAEALFAHGGSAAEKEASEVTLAGITRNGVISESLLCRFIDCNIKRGMPRLIASLVSSLSDGALLCVAFDRIGLLLNDSKVAHAFEREWASGLDRLLRSDVVDENRKKRYSAEFGSILEQSKRNKPRLVS